MAYHDGGQFCLDKNGAIFVRYGENILKISAMVSFDGMLVCGCGMAGGGNYPNLLFFDKDTYQEKGAISAGTASDNTITSEWTSKTYGVGDDKRKRLTRIEITYVNKQAYQHGTNSGFKFYYRVDGAVDTTATNQVTGEYLPNWTEISSVSTTLSDTSSDKDTTHTIRPLVNLNLEGRLWQFQISSDYDFKIIGFTPYLLPTTGLEDR